MARRPANSTVNSASAERIRVDAPMIEGFVETFLLDTYDSPYPVPDFHRDLWTLECSTDRWVAAAAPRGHAKSTSGNHAYVLANLCFGNDDFSVIFSSSERLAVSHLKSIKDQCWENKDLQSAFELNVVRDVETELVCRVRGREFCVMAFGSEANLRGALWRQRRPSLVLGDDLEDDEMVESPERREKFWNWLLKAVMPMGSDRARFRILGTILHEASALNRLLKMESWKSCNFTAHADFDDFSNILWPEKFPEERLRMERQSYIDANNESGYSQEYLGRPIAQGVAFFRKTDFRPMDDRIRAKPKLYYGAIDFAIDKKTKNDYTVFIVGGLTDEGLLCIVDVKRERLDSLQIVDEWFRLDLKWHIEMWWAEDGAINKAIGPFLNLEMIKRGHFMSVEPKNPVKDKRSRASSFQARTRAGGVLYDMLAEWWPAYQQEMLAFDRGLHDDQVDGSAWLGLGLDEMANANTPEEEADEAYEQMRRDSTPSYEGRSTTTGY